MVSTYIFIIFKRRQTLVPLIEALFSSAAWQERPTAQRNTSVNKGTNGDGIKQRRSRAQEAGMLPHHLTSNNFVLRIWKTDPP